MTDKKSLLWTDSRYYIQAEKELDSDWTMIKMEKNQTDLKTYIKENLPVNSNIGLDMNLITASISVLI
jgi:Xaa-Pro aminopeptidase